MGLPFWRDPEEKSIKDAVKTDPTAAARSPIRRRPSMSRINLRWTSLLERSHPGSPPPPPAMSPPPPLPVPAPMSGSSRLREARSRDRLGPIRSTQHPGVERDGNRSLQRGHESPARRFLPTPPLDVSEQEISGGANVPTISVQPISGLGDRVRSPSPINAANQLSGPPSEPAHVDTWQIIRETMTPDQTLSSAGSSLRSAAVQTSFTSTSDSTNDNLSTSDHLAGSTRRALGEGECPSDSDSSSGPSTNQSLHVNTVRALRTEMRGNFSALQEQHDASISAYEDEITSLREDVNALRDRLRHIDPTATLPPAYPAHHAADHGNSNNTDSNQLHPYRGPWELRRHNGANPSHPPFLLESDTHVPGSFDIITPIPYSQHHLGVDRNGQLQLLPRDRTLTRVPSLRREDSLHSGRGGHGLNAARDQRTDDSIHLRTQREMHDQHHRSLLAAGFTSRDIERLSSGDETWNMTAAAQADLEQQRPHGVPAMLHASFDDTMEGESQMPPRSPPDERTRLQRRMDRARETPEERRRRIEARIQAREQREAERSAQLPALQREEELLNQQEATMRARETELARQLSAIRTASFARFRAIHDYVVIPEGQRTPDHERRLAELRREETEASIQEVLTERAFEDIEQFKQRRESVRSRIVDILAGEEPPSLSEEEEEEDYGREMRGETGWASGWSGRPGYVDDDEDDDEHEDDDEDHEDDEPRQRQDQDQEREEVDSMFRGIMHRMSRRQDVPDGMWLRAGLSRDVVEPRTDGAGEDGTEEVEHDEGVQVTPSAPFSR